MVSDKNVPLCIYGMLACTRKIPNCCSLDCASTQRKFNSHSGALLKIMSRGSELPWREYCDHYNSLALAAPLDFLRHKYTSSSHWQPSRGNSIPPAIHQQDSCLSPGKKSTKPAAFMSRRWCRRRLIFYAKSLVSLLGCLYLLAVCALAPKLHVNFLSQKRAKNV